MINTNNYSFMYDAHYKLVKDYKKVSSINNWFQEKDKIGGDLGEKATLGTFDNGLAIMGTATIPAAPLAVGLTAAAAGLVALLPVFMAGPPLNSSEAQIISQINGFSGNMMGFAGQALDLSLKLSAIPAGVALLSVPKGLFRLITGKVNDAAEPTLKSYREMIKLIEDLLNGEQDESLTFIRNFFKNVDLSKNSKKFNYELLDHLAYLRYCFKGVDEKRMKEEDAQEAFNNVIYYMQFNKDKAGVSEEFRKNKFVNFLIDEYGYEEDLEPQKGR